jgi:hypothetical protein
MPWGMASALDQGNNLTWALPWGEVGHIDVDIMAPWSKPGAADVDNVLPWGGTFHRDADIQIPWLQTIPTDPDIVLPWVKTIDTDADTVLPWAKTGTVDVSTVLPWWVMTAVDIETRLAWGKTLSVDVGVKCPWSKTIALDVSNFTGFTEGTGTVIEQRITTEWMLPWIADKGLLMIQNEFSCKRVLDDVEVPVVSGNLGIDLDSWYWTFDGNLPSRESMLLIDPDLNGGPVEIELTINEYTWRFVVIRVSDNYSYGSGSYTFKASSLAVELADPYAPKTTKTWSSAVYANALVSQELSPYGWTADWNILDWMIDANVFSVQNAAPADTIKRVAQAVGGVVQADPVSKILSFDYMYPDSPADWPGVTPYEILTSGVITGQSASWEPQPKYNYVIVSGKDSGVMVHVKRSGTSYDRPAPAIADELILTSQAAVQRGRNELDQYGYDVSRLQLSMPLPHQSSGDRPKLLLPGKVVQVQDLWRTFYGQVMSVGISFGPPAVVMSVEVDRAIIE